MVLFIVSKLLLMTLLLQPTEANREWKTHTTRKPENSERFGEFCLRISDDSQWTSSKPGTQLPTKSAHPTKQPSHLPKQPTQLPKQPTHLPKQPTQLPKQPTQLPKQPTQLPKQPTHLPKQSTQLPQQPTQLPKQPTHLPKQSTQLPQQPTKPSKQAPKLPKQATQPNRDSAQVFEQPTTETTYFDDELTQPPTQSTQLPQQTTHPDLLNIVTQDSSDTVLPVMAPIVLPGQGCRCKKENIKQPAEPSTVMSVMIWLPTETCSSTEFIETMMDGTEVCVTSISLLEFIGEQNLSHSSNPAIEVEQIEEPPITSPPPLDSTTPQPTSETIPNEEKKENSGRGLNNLKDRLAQICEWCNLRINMEDIDPKAVQSLNVKMQPFLCPVLIYVNLEGDNVSCWGQPLLETLLEKLEDHFGRALTNIVHGCRCQESEKKPPAEPSTVKSIRIWPPNERCSSSEFIETLMDGREVCVAASSLSAYLDFALHQQYVPVIEEGPPSLSEVKTDTLHFDFLREQHLPLRKREEGALQRAEIQHVVVVCMRCLPTENWNNIDSKDVQSLRMHVQSIGCPVLLHISLKNKEEFCVDSSQPWFGTLLDKLDIQST
ncbi:uncharacterized protein LOC108890196 isoform X2 [Lates calcarifer]|uniref:Uncharacterized protein LOC108890196 isoform X2 n=1 Tax=Lates calcarifer TaxID=8187 RepID=A0AAJ8B1B3_LATCA|nr:uncharacterized protein LOC108890196 isoform X2 [Lates calcarifer]